MTSQPPPSFSNLSPIVVTEGFPSPTDTDTLPTTPQLRVDVLGGRPVVRLRWPRSNEYYGSWFMEYAVVRRMYQYVCAKRAAGRFDKRWAYKSCRLFRLGAGRRGAWRLKVLRKELRIGCQAISYKELAAFAAVQDWPPLPKTKRKAKAS